ncbi:MAG TPA: ABC transporter permease [Symbiobacteriaceae bacterium]
MSLGQIVARSVWQNRGRYLSYFGSAAFAVTIYFLYTALVLHPDLQSTYTGTPAVVLAQGMKAATVVLAIFTFLFLLYANAAFVRSRVKEFGLLSLMGMTKKQLVGLVLCEGLVVGAGALAAGLGMGVIFLKLFFMAVSALLHLPEQIPVYAGLPVWLRTAGVFGSFFVLVSLLSLHGILRRSVIELIRAARQPKEAPVFSRGKAALGLILVAGGYVWACLPSQVMIILGIIPVTTMVSVGTYFLMREGSIAVLQWLHCRERYFHRPGPFLNITQLIFKMQDNYRVLSDVAILVAVILTAIGTVVSGFLVLTNSEVADNPMAIQLVQKGRADLTAHVAQVESILASTGVEGLTSFLLETRSVQFEEMRGSATLVPYSVYRALRPPGENRPVITEPGEAILVYPSTAKGATPFRDRVIVNTESVELHLLPDASGRFFNDNVNALYALVVPDDIFADWMSGAPEEDRLTFAFWTGPNWKSSQMANAVAALRALYPETHPDPEQPGPFLSTTRETYDAAITWMGIALFIGIFVSLVFFAACCSLIFFRLFTEIEDDRKYYHRLQQVGASERELKRLAWQQSMVIFFVPFLAGLIHSTFAMKALGTLLQQTVLQYGWAVAVAYLLLYLLYFAASGSAYWRSIQAGLNRPAWEGI